MTLVLDPIEIPVPPVPVSTPQPTQPTTIADTLFQASDVLEKGWIREVRHHKGRYCALGAIERVHRIHWHEFTAGLSTVTLNFLSDYLISTNLCSLYVSPYDGQSSKVGTVCHWNNASNQATVVATFREAAEAARKLGV